MNREIDFDLDEALFSDFSEINDEISKKDISIKTKDLIEIERLRAMIPTLTASSPRLDLSRNLLTFSSLNSTLLFRIYGSHSISQVGKPSSLRLLSHSYSSTPSLNSQEVSETASLPCPERKASKKASHLRPHLLATLPLAYLRPEVTREVVKDRLTRLFACQALLLAKERVGEGYNWQAGILSTNASSHTAQSLLQEAFPEWQGSEIGVHFKKAWSSLCRLIHQLDQAPFVCGDFSLEEVSQIARSRQRKKATRKTIPGPIVESGTAEQQLPEPGPFQEARSY